MLFIHHLTSAYLFASFFMFFFFFFVQLVYSNKRYLTGVRQSNKTKLLLDMSVFPYIWIFGVSDPKAFQANFDETTDL